MGKRVDWSQLPKELWALIAKHVNANIDLLRFRSVCKTWRSALPLPPSLTLFTIQIPVTHAGYSLRRTKIYTLQPLLSSSKSKAFLIKVGHSKFRPTRVLLLDPFTNQRLSNTKDPLKFLNLLNFRVIEFIETFSLRTGRDDVSVSSIRKVMLFPGLHVQDRMLFAVFKDGRLCVSTIGDQDWIILDDGNQIYDDIILHKGQIYVVDKWGIIFWIDCSSFNLVQFSPLLGFGKRKHLVESAGSFYVVDMYMEGDVDSQVVDIKVYKLDEEWGRWVEVKNLGHVLFVLCDDSNFSLSSQDYYGCEGNCIYFYSAGKTYSFCLRNSKFKTPNPFCPCPSLFHRKFNFYNI